LVVPADLVPGEPLVGVQPVDVLGKEPLAETLARVAVIRRGPLIKTVPGSQGALLGFKALRGKVEALRLSEREPQLPDRPPER